MTKTYLAVADHWNVPGIQQYSAPDRAAANRKCVDLVNELIDDWAKWVSKSSGATVPPHVIGTDWQSSLQALQLSRLVDYYGGEGEANDELYQLAKRKGMREPPSIGEAKLRDLGEYINALVEEDDEAGSDCIGFPKVWIEEVDAVDDQPPMPSTFGALDLGELMSALGYAAEHTRLWASDEDPITDEERAQAAKACELVEQCQKTVPALFQLLGRVQAVLGYGIGAIDALDHQVGQMEGMFPDDDGTIQQARDDGTETSHMLGKARDDLKALGVPRSEPVQPVQPVRIVVDVTGGCVQGAVADGVVVLFVADYDTDSIDEDAERDLVDLPQADGRIERGFFGGLDVHHDPALVEAMLAAKHAHVEAGDNG